MQTIKTIIGEWRVRGLTLLLVAGSAWLAGCASDPADVEDRSIDESPSLQSPAQARAKTPPGGSYRVVKGDTLYSIAFKRGLDYRDVAAWNGIEAPAYKILVGQEIRFSPPGAPAAPVQEHVTTAIAAPAETVSSHSTAASSAGNSPSPASVPAAPKNTGLFEDVPSTPAAAAATQAESVASTSAASATVAPPPSPAAVAAAPVAQPAKAAPEPASPPAPKPINEASISNVSGIAWRWPNGGKVIGGYVAGDQTKQGVDIAGSAGDPVQAAADGEVVYSGNGLLGYGELIIVKHNAKFLSAYGHNRKRLVSEGDKVHAGQQIAEMGSSSASRDELHFEIRKDGKPVNPLDFLPPR